jgi:hypothetical protein
MLASRKCNILENQVLQDFQRLTKTSSIMPYASQYIEWSASIPAWQSVSLSCLNQVGVHRKRKRLLACHTLYGSKINK